MFPTSTCSILGTLFNFSLIKTLRACTTLLLGEGYTSGPDVVLGRPTRAQQCYPTDLTAAQWAQWARPLLPPPGIGPPLRHEQRVLGNAILQVLRSGCPWRLRPHDFPPWSTVYQHCRKWRDEGLWAEGMHAVRHQERQRRETGRWRPGPSSATASRSRRPQKGAAWRRWRPAGDRAQAAAAGGSAGHAGRHAQRRGAAPALGGGPHLRVAGPLPAVAPGLCSISGHQRDRDGVGHVCAVTLPVVPTFISVVHPLRINAEMSNTSLSLISYSSCSVARFSASYIFD